MKANVMFIDVPSRKALTRINEAERLGQSVMHYVDITSAALAGSPREPVKSIHCTIYADVDVNDILRLRSLNPSAELHVYGSQSNLSRYKRTLDEVRARIVS